MTNRILSSPTCASAARGVDSESNGPPSTSAATPARRVHQLFGEAAGAGRPPARARCGAWSCFVAVLGASSFTYAEAYTLALHAGLSKAEGEPDNPHLHLVFSERVNDEVEPCSGAVVPAGVVVGPAGDVDPGRGGPG